MIETRKRLVHGWAALLTGGTLLAGCGSDSSQPNPRAAALRQRVVGDESGRRPASSLSQPAQPPTWHPEVLAPLETLTQYDNGPGLAVCPPVPAGGDANVAAFGRGCSLWLHLAAGGRPELSRTPLVGWLRQVTSPADPRSAKVTAANAGVVAKRLGVDYVAVGDIATSGAARTLTYRLLKFPGAQPVGEELRAAGTPREVAARLPGLAQELLQRVGIAGERVPAVPVEDPELLTRACRLAPDSSTPLLFKQAESLKGMDESSVVAALLDLTQQSGVQDATTFAALAASLERRAPENALLYADSAPAASRSGSGASELIDHGGRLWKQYPQNLALNAAQAHYFLANAFQPEEAVRSAQEAVRCSTQSPQAWRLLAQMVDLYGAGLTQGRTPGQGGVGETATLRPLREYAVACARRTIELDPDDWRLWVGVSRVTATAGDRAEAERALERAVALGPLQWQVWDWGLELYGPERFSDPRKREQLARRAAAQPWLGEGPRATIAARLREAGFPALANPISPPEEYHDHGF
jgi:tetratricopeptide (TPR) repeat protein